MPEAEYSSLVRKGIAAVEKNDFMMAMVHFKDAAKLQKTPLVCSYLGYCLGRDRGHQEKAVSLCKEAIQAEPGNPVHYLNLGRVYAVSGQKMLAIKTFQRGLKFGRNTEIMAELKALGLRGQPVFTAFHREHFLNRYLGLLLHRMGIR
jgi:Flp pilus assembly protein TadD